jgi:hypothetical protein
MQDTVTVKKIKALVVKRNSVIESAMMSFLLNFFEIEPHRFYDKPSYCSFHIYSQMFEIIEKFGRDDHRSFSFIYHFACSHVRY